ncbi:hypothetical protein [Alistipes sp.]|uniref:hypothetical protein n=1 Tax=Alistipes sp. TaxID=1872444 RepID=UPI003AF0CF27
MANEITGATRIDASKSTQTVRELQNEVGRLTAELHKLKAGTEEYAAAQQLAAQKQQELTAAFEISRGAAAEMETSAKRLAAAAAENQKAVAGVVEAMRAWRGAAIGTDGVLQESAATLSAVTDTLRRQTAAVSELRTQQNELARQAADEASVLEEVIRVRKELNDAIAAGVISEQAAASEKQFLRKVEADYQASLSQTQAELRAATAQMQAAEGSYNGMSRQVDTLRDAYRQLGAAARESTEGKQLIGQLIELAAGLKSVDAEMGNHRRNVDSYQSALGGLGKAFGATKGALGLVRVGMEAAVGVFHGLIEAAKSTQKTGDALNMAVAAWSSGWEVFKKNLAAGSFENLSARMLEAARAGRELAAILDGVFERTNSINLQAARLDEENVKLCADMRNVNLSYEERIAAGNKYLDNVTSIREQEIANAVQVRDAQLENLFALTNTREFASRQEREAAKEELANGIERYNLRQQEIEAVNDYISAQSQANALHDSISQAEFGAVRVAEQATRAQENANEAYARLKGIAGENTESLIAFVKQYNLSNDEQVKGYVDAEIACRKLTASTLSDQQQIMSGIDSVRTEQERAEQARQTAARQAGEEAQRAAEQENRRAKAIADANREVERRVELMKAERIPDAEGGEFAVAQVKYQQELEDFNAMVAEKGITEANAMAYREQLQAQFEENIRNIHNENLQEQTADLMRELDKEMEATFKAGEKILKEEQKGLNEKKKIEKAKRETVLNVASSTLGSLSSILGEETAAGKAAAVAAATIDTYKAANSAYAALSGVPFVGPALGAAAAAAAVVAGIANVKKILSTSTDSSGSSASTPSSVATPTVVTPPAVIQQVPVIRTLTGASEEERLNQMAGDQRVYLVYSDVEQAGRQVEVQQTETTF